MASTETDLNRELEFKRRELRWVRENPAYIIKIGLEPWKKENEMYQGYIEFLAMMGVTLVWMAVMYLIAKLKGE